MMNYKIIKVIDGDFSLEDTDYTTKEDAINDWYDVCKEIRSTSNIIKATISIVDENLDSIDGGKYKEYIIHPVVETTPTEE